MSLGATPISVASRSELCVRAFHFLVAGLRQNSSDQNCRVQQCLVLDIPQGARFVPVLISFLWHWVVLSAFILLCPKLILRS
jgi:hypothetical protein